MKLCESCHNGFIEDPDFCPVCGANLDAGELLVGQELAGMRIDDKYELVELLGEGAMGWVYRGVHRSLQRSVAVKLLKTSLQTQPELIRRFEQEARAVSRLNHPHIVSVIDFGRTPGGLLYLVTEFVEGTDLAELLALEGRLPMTRVLGIFHQILAAVEEAHGNQVIHRDLKPENIAVAPLRSGEDFVKVLDFGIAMLRDERRPRMTAQGATVGTPGFMAPETIREGVATERSDVYSLGNVLYELLVGHPPFEHEWPMALLSMHLNDDPVPLREAAPDEGYPEELERVVATALAKDPAERFGSIAEFRADLLTAFNRLAPQHLNCDRCNRPRNPDTGLCSLHGPSSPPAARPRPLVSGPPISTPSPSPLAPPVDSSSGTVLRNTHIGRASLVERVRGLDVALRQDVAESVVDFMLGHDALLEVMGDPGSGRASLLQGLAQAAEAVELRLLELRPDPHRALRPWYPVRRLIGELLGCGPEPSSHGTVTSRARAQGVAPEHEVGLSLLFGYLPSDAPPEWFDRARAIRSASAAVIQATSASTAGTCVVAFDVLGYDRASQSFIRTLPGRLSANHSKLAISSDGAFWSTLKARRVIRPSPVDANSVTAMLDRAGLSDYAEKASLTAKVAQVCNGNSFHAMQAVLAHADGVELDGTLPELLYRRLERLPSEAPELLRVVSALGAEVDVELLDGLVDESVKLLATDLLLRRGYLKSEPDRSLSVAHPAMAHALWEGMSRAERITLHGAILDRLEQVGASVFVRAHHAHEAERHEQALELLTEAADQACHDSDVETAALVHFRKAAHIARWGLLWSDEDPRYLELMLKMGNALYASGHNRASEVVYREILGSAGKQPALHTRAKRALDRVVNAAPLSDAADAS